MKFLGFHYRSQKNIYSRLVASIGKPEISGVYILIKPCTI